MPSSDWRSNFAIAGGIVIGLLLAFNYALLVAGAKYPCTEYAASETQKAAPKQERPNRLSVREATQEKAADPGVYEADCQKPKDHDAADLCEQRRMANAAEEAGCISRVQLWLSGFGIVLVLGSLWLTGWAAVAASCAVHVAVAADRPRVRLSNLIFSRWHGEEADINKIPIITATIKNYGRSAAILTQAHMAIVVVGSLPKFPDYKKCHPLFIGVGKTIEPGGEHTFRPIYFFDVAPHIPKEGDALFKLGLPFKAHFHVYGFVEFLDHVGELRRHGFRALYNPPNVAAVGHEGGQFIWQRIKHYAYDT